MIYYNYPTYYRIPTNFNAKYENRPNSPTSHLKNNSSYTISPYNTTNKQQKNFQNSTQKTTQKNVRRNNSINCQSISEITPKPKKTPPKSNDDIVFEIFGIKLYFDDILLICLIFFLYDEGVHDQYLFITLILLLLS